MKKSKKIKILGMLMVFIFTLVSMNIPSNAAITSSSTSSITVTGLEKGVTAYAYKIATVNVDDSTGSPEDPMYSWVSSVSSWLSSSSLYSNYADIDTFAALDTSTDADTLADFYSALTAVIVDGSISLTASSTQYTSGTADYPVTTNQSVTFSTMSMGLYVIYITGGYQIYSPVVAQLVPEYSDSAWSLSSVTAAAKAESISISKTLDSDTTDVSGSDDLTYTITADVIDYDESAVNTTYAITDTYGSGLSISTSNITVYGVDASGNSTKLTANTAYTISTGTSSFTVDFVYDQISSYSSVKIVYTASFNLGTSLDYSNTVSLTYSSDPYEEETTDGDSDITIGGGSDETTGDDDTEVTIYQYGIEITTVDSSSKSTITSSSTFNLYDSDGNILYFYNQDGVYYNVNSSYTGAKTSLITSSGALTIYGLSTGTYKLQQTSAPDGYVLNSTSQSLTITDDYDSDGASGADGIIDGDTDEYLSVTFTNSEGYSLPTTGGIGIAIFTIVGLTLIVVGIRIGLKKEKKN